MGGNRARSQPYRSLSWVRTNQTRRFLSPFFRIADQRPINYRGDRVLEFPIHAIFFLVCVAVILFPYLLWLFLRAQSRAGVPSYLASP